MWGHTRMENECSETKERAEKQLLTVNSVNPVVLPLLIFLQDNLALPQKEIGKAHHQNAFFIITRTIPIPYDYQFAEAIVYIQ